MVGFCLQNGRPMVQPDLGNRLRALRLSRQCSVAELARRSGIGKGTISELENGRRDARLETLFALTTALDAPLGAVLSPEGTRDEPVSGASVHATLLTTWMLDGERVEVYRARLTPTAQSSAPHATGVEETVTVLRGAVLVGPRGQERELRTGESRRYPGDQPHHFSSLGENASALLVMHYPEPGGEST